MDAAPGGVLLHGPHRAAERLGRLRLGQVAQVAERQDLALAAGEAQQRGHEGRPLVDRCAALSGVRVGRCQPGTVGGAAAPTADLPQGEVGGDAGDPGLRVGLDLPPAGRGAGEGLLRRVLGVGPRPQQPVRDAVGQAGEVVEAIVEVGPGQRHPPLNAWAPGRLTGTAFGVGGLPSVSFPAGFPRPVRGAGTASSSKS